MSLTSPEGAGVEGPTMGPADERETVLDETYPALLYSLLKLSNLIGRPFFTHFADRYDLAMNDVRVLMRLAHVGQAASHELCEATGMHPMNVSRSVARLKRQGRITDRADPDNRRRKLLTPTDEGRALYHTLAPHVKVLSEYVLATLSQREVEFLSSLLEVLTDRLEMVDLDSTQLIDAEALERQKQEDAAKAPPPPAKSRRRRAAAPN